MCVLSINVFFTIGSQNRDLDALLPGNGSELRHASFCFLEKIGISDGKSAFSVGNRHFLGICCCFLNIQKWCNPHFGLLGRFGDLGVD